MSNNDSNLIKEILSGSRPIVKSLNNIGSMSPNRVFANDSLVEMVAMKPLPVQTQQNLPSSMATPKSTPTNKSK